MSKYIFVVTDESWDTGILEMVTTDCKQAVEYAYLQGFTLKVWGNGKTDSLVEFYMKGSIEEDIKHFKKLNDMYKLSELCSDLLPLLEAIQKEYNEKMAADINARLEKKRQKELKQFAELKAKYENA